MDLEVSPALTIPASELGWRFSRSSGPGGQHINTSDSRVELSWNVADSAALSDGQRLLLLTRLGRRLIAGVITVTASERRSQLRNRENAPAKLSDSPTSWRRVLLPKLLAAGRPNPPGARTVGASPPRNSGRRRIGNASGRPPSEQVAESSAPIRLPLWLSLSVLTVLGVGTASVAAKGFSVTIVAAYGIMLALVLVSIVLAKVTRKISAIVYITTIGAYISSPWFFGAEALTTVIKSVDFLSIATVMMALAGLSLGNDIPLLKNIGWKIIPVGLVAITASFLLHRDRGVRLGALALDAAAAPLSCGSGERTTAGGPAVVRLRWQHDQFLGGQMKPLTWSPRSLLQLRLWRSGRSRGLPGRRAGRVPVPAG